MDIFLKSFLKNMNEDNTKMSRVDLVCKDNQQS